MARILYGIMGNTWGHWARTQALVDGMKGEHEFFFVGGGRVAELMKGRENFLEVPVLRTVHRKHRVSVTRTVGYMGSCLSVMGKVKRSLLEVVDKFKPDVAVVDREFFLPWVAKAIGLPLISIDHSHVMKACEYPVPWRERISWALAMMNDYVLYDLSRYNLIVSFFHPPLKQRQRAGEINRLLGPVLRKDVKRYSGKVGDYVFVYQTSATFKGLLPVLKQLKREVVIYGMSAEDRREGNLHFRAFDVEGLLRDLSGACYAVVNGGHNVICEALYYGKPVFCFPIHGLFEQFLNAWHVASLGYGAYSVSMRPCEKLFKNFEMHLEKYREQVLGKFRDGTEEACRVLEEVIDLKRKEG